MIWQTIERSNRASKQCYSVLCANIKKHTIDKTVLCANIKKHTINKTVLCANIKKHTINKTSNAILYCVSTLRNTQLTKNKQHYSVFRANDKKHTIAGSKKELKAKYGI